MPGTESEGSAPLLARNLEEMDQSVKQMLKLIEEDGSDNGANNSDVYQQKRPELIAHIESFSTMYRSLAEEVAKGVGSGISEQGSPQLTPADKLSLHKSGMDMSPSSGGGSSEPSLKGGSESFSSSSSDSESESFSSSIKNYLDSPLNLDGKGEKMCKLEAEEELKVAKLQLKRSEEEVARLKIELEKNEVDMRAQLESAHRAIEAREADLDVERRHGLEMQEQIALLETQVLDSRFKMKQLMEEFEMGREKLKDLDEENAKLKQELESKVSEETQKMQGQLDLAMEDIRVLEGKLDLEKVQVLELQKNIVKYQAEVSDRDHEVRELEAALCDAHENFSNEKAQLQSEIDRVLEECTLLDAKLNEWELRSKSLEEKLKQSEAEKLEMKSSTDALEFGLRAEINDLNKTLDGLKYKYDMLMTEKDMANAKIDTLVAEGSAQDNQIQQMEEHIGQLRIENANSVADSDELRLKVEELEKEVERLKIAISNGAEEKREAIRQLCFSLEHYRSGYQELRQAFIGQKRHAVMAS